MPTTKFVAVGPHAGKTILLANFQFIDGVFVFEGSDTEAALIGHTLATQYSAHREDRAAKAVERYESALAEAALAEPEASTLQAEEATLKERLIARRFLIENLSPDTAYGKGPAADRIKSVMADILKEEGVQNFEPSDAETPEPIVVEPVAVTAVVSVGGEVTAVAKAKEPITVAEALAVLDRNNDMHWTARGIPSVDAVSSILARGVTRSEIEAVAPDLTRTTARMK